MRTEITVRLLFVLLLVAAARCSAAKTAPSVLTAPPLDVVSVKPDSSDPQSGQLGLRTDGIYASNTPLRFMLEVAFRRRFDGRRIVNLPAWAGTERFDVAGKVAESDLPKLHGLSGEQYDAMRSGLLLEALVDRFHLRTHVEEHDGPVYALVVAKGGPKMTKVGEDAPRSLPGTSASLTAFNGEISGHIVSLRQLTEALSRAGQLDRPIVDRTGLTGVYDFALKWTPDATPAPADNGAPDNDQPALFTAIQEQLGLKLVPTKGPVETLVIDHIERPSAN